HGKVPAEKTCSENYPSPRQRGANRRGRRQTDTADVHFRKRLQALLSRQSSAADGEYPEVQDQRRWRGRWIPGHPVHWFFFSGIQLLPELAQHRHERLCLPDSRRMEVVLRV